MEKRIYGQWAGNPKGREEDVSLCVESVQDSTGWHSYQCSRKRGHGIDGLYCKQHARKHERKPTQRVTDGAEWSCEKGHKNYGDARFCLWCDAPRR